MCFENDWSQEKVFAGHNAELTNHLKPGSCFQSCFIKDKMMSLNCISLLFYFSFHQSS